ncbi:hypothetical protein DFH06DRAFT_1122226 [Mycena polygramma]|nr:hypothetical protein DFH06DRAFT_1122226 [Mycena polygramma]
MEERDRDEEAIGAAALPSLHAVSSVPHLNGVADTDTDNYAETPAERSSPSSVDEANEQDDHDDASNEAAEENGKSRAISLWRPEGGVGISSGVDMAHHDARGRTSRPVEPITEARPFEVSQYRSERMRLRCVRYKVLCTPACRRTLQRSVERRCHGSREDCVTVAEDRPRGLCRFWVLDRRADGGSVCVDGRGQLGAKRAQGESRNDAQVKDTPTSLRALVLSDAVYIYDGDCTNTKDAPTQLTVCHCQAILQ